MYCGKTDFEIHVYIFDNANVDDRLCVTFFFYKILIAVFDIYNTTGE